MYFLYPRVYFNYHVTGCSTPRSSPPKFSPEASMTKKNVNNDEQIRMYAKVNTAAADVLTFEPHCNVDGGFLFSVSASFMKGM